MNSAKSQRALKNVKKLTRNSFTSMQDMEGGLKLETILEVCAFSLCRVLKALFLVKDLSTLFSNKSCSSWPLPVNVLSKFDPPPFVRLASSSFWVPSSKSWIRAFKAVFSTSILSNSVSSSRRRLWTLFLALEADEEEELLLPLSRYLWKPADILLFKIQALISLHSFVLSCGHFCEIFLPALSIIWQFSDCSLYKG